MEIKRHKNIAKFANTVLKTSIQFIKKTKGSGKRMPFKEIKKLMDIYFPKTKDFKKVNGRYKHVFVIHFRKKKFALKVGRNKKDIRKDFKTYQEMFKKTKNRYFSKIYWATDIFMLQKYGEKATVPSRELERLKAIGRDCGLKDVRPANIMRFGKKFKIVDAERRR